MNYRLLTMIGLAFLSWSCSSSDGEEATSGTSDVADAATEDAEGPDPRVNCENACKRAPRCEQALVTEADCLALCAKGDPYDTPRDYACCLQFAEGCPGVLACLEGLGSCVEEGEPWIELALYDECECGDPDNPTPDTHDCKRTGPDQPCPQPSLCVKPPNSSKPPFCAVECTQNAGACSEDTKCEVTPKFWYCKKK